MLKEPLILVKRLFQVELTTPPGELSTKAIPARTAHGQVPSSPAWRAQKHWDRLHQEFLVVMASAVKFAWV